MVQSDGALTIPDHSSMLKLNVTHNPQIPNCHSVQNLYPPAGTTSWISVLKVNLLQLQLLMVLRSVYHARLKPIYLAHHICELEEFDSHGTPCRVHNDK